jgi:hypothetical protein
VRSRHRFGWKCREFEELGALVYRVSLGAHGRRSAAYAASPFLIVMARIVPLRVPINHPSRSSRMSVFPEDATESIMSADVESGDPGLAADWVREWTERGGLPEGPVRPVFVVEGLELAQGVKQVALAPDQSAVQQLASASLDPALSR